MHLVNYYMLVPIADVIAILFAFLFIYSMSASYMFTGILHILICNIFMMYSLSNISKFYAIWIWSVKFLVLNIGTEHQSM